MPLDDGVRRRAPARGAAPRAPARRTPDDGRSFLFELTARGDREWRRGWGALQRINERSAASSATRRCARALTELGAAFAAALTDD